jgi:hypothetical protein
VGKSFAKNWLMFHVGDNRVSQVPLVMSHWQAFGK